MLEEPKKEQEPKKEEILPAHMVNAEMLQSEAAKKKDRSVTINNNNNNNNNNQHEEEEKQDESSPQNERAEKYSSMAKTANRLDKTSDPMSSLVLFGQVLNDFKRLSKNASSFSRPPTVVGNQLSPNRRRANSDTNSPTNLNKSAPAVGFAFFCFSISY